MRENTRPSLRSAVEPTAGVTEGPSRCPGGRLKETDRRRAALNAGAFVDGGLPASYGAYPVCKGCLVCSRDNGCVSCQPKLFLFLRRERMRQYGECLHDCPPGYYGMRSPEINMCSSRSRRRPRQHPTLRPSDTRHSDLRHSDPPNHPTLRPSDTPTLRHSDLRHPTPNTRPSGQAPDPPTLPTLQHTQHS
ncbi:hypothetical protein CRUP_028187 [Coryphaenoides rupestris]|nr:hypothetical protein CRUP_028187 [Coryphaenoides rupestris]